MVKAPSAFRKLRVRGSGLRAGERVKFSLNGNGGGLRPAGMPMKIGCDILVTSLALR